MRPRHTSGKSDPQFTRKIWTKQCFVVFCSSDAIRNWSRSRQCKPISIGSQFQALSQPLWHPTNKVATFCVVKIFQLNRSYRFNTCDEIRNGFQLWAMSHLTLIKYFAYKNALKTERRTQSICENRRFCRHPSCLYKTKTYYDNTST